MPKCQRCGEYHEAGNWHPRGVFKYIEWDDEERCDDNDYDADCDDNGQRWYRKEKDETFHLGEDIEKYVCNQCGGDKFIVGGAAWQTMMKCCGCGWETIIHNG